MVSHRRFRIAFTSKLTTEQREEIADKYYAGTHNQGELAKEYDVAAVTIRRVCTKLKHKARLRPHTPIASIIEFEKRAHSVIWRQDSGKPEDRKTSLAWYARVKELESEEGANYTHNQAVVRASKEFPCLHQLFREYDLKEFDPNPDSHATVKHQGYNTVKSVHCENKEQSYRENLQWAMEAAGEYSRTSMEPATCPNNAAFYLYTQAQMDPKDFLSKVGQVESKNSGESEAEKGARIGGERSIAELDSMLAELESEEREDAT